MYTGFCLWLVASIIRKHVPYMLHNWKPNSLSVLLRAKLKTAYGSQSTTIPLAALRILIRGLGGPKEMHSASSVEHKGHTYLEMEMKSMPYLHNYNHRDVSSSPFWDGFTIQAYILIAEFLNFITRRFELWGRDLNEAAVHWLYLYANLNQSWMMEELLMQKGSWLTGGNFNIPYSVC